MGMKTKLNHDLIKQIAKMIELGTPNKYVAQAIGVDITTWYKWLQRGERAKSGIYFDLFVSVKKAEAKAISRNVSIIQKAAIDNWQAAAWWLERRYPEEFGKKNETILSGKGENGEIRIVKVRADARNQGD
jgi:transposase